MADADRHTEDRRDADREAEIAAFLAHVGWGDADRSVLARDMSYRTYDRLRRGAESAVLMNAPPALEDVRPFLDIARQLTRLGLSAPRILAEDAAAGLLLLEDLGDRTFTRELAAGVDETALYELAVDLIAALHRRAAKHGFTAPPYDADRLVEEADRFLRWYVPLVTGERVPEAAAEAWRTAWRACVPVLTHGPETLVLRDFHVDNLMHLPDREGVARCGLLDFQDALTGSAAYDLVSLLQDSRRDLAPGLEAAMLDRCLATAPVDGGGAFRRSYHALGAQRGLKVLAMFGRQLGFFGRTTALAHIPRTWAHIERDVAAAGLDPVIDWLDRHFPPSLRRVPDAGARLPASISPIIPR
ncbi:MAG: phosphotransferase [Alphaproteobacteria bacterium]|nr:phosphotransferase [Alphaproteobacteria bacterium]